MGFQLQIKGAYAVFNQGICVGTQLRDFYLLFGQGKEDSIQI